MEITKIRELKGVNGLTVKEIREFLHDCPPDMKVWIKGSGFMERIEFIEYGFTDIPTNEYIYMEGELYNKFTKLDKVIQSHSTQKSDINLYTDDI